MNTATATFCFLFLQLIALRFDNKVLDVSMTNSVCGFNGEKQLDPGAFQTILYHSPFKVFYSQVCRHYHTKTPLLASIALNS